MEISDTTLSVRWISDSRALAHVLTLNQVLFPIRRANFIPAVNYATRPIPCQIKLTHDSPSHFPPPKEIRPDWRSHRTTLTQPGVYSPVAALDFTKQFAPGIGPAPVATSMMVVNGLYDMGANVWELTENEDVSSKGTRDGSW